MALRAFSASTWTSFSRAQGTFPTWASSRARSASKRDSSAASCPAWARSVCRQAHQAAPTLRTNRTATTASRRLNLAADRASRSGVLPLFLRHRFSRPLAAKRAVWSGQRVLPPEHFLCQHVVEDLIALPRRLIRSRCDRRQNPAFTGRQPHQQRPQLRSGDSQRWDTDPRRQARSWCRPA